MRHAGNALKYLSLLFMFVAFPYQNAVAQNGNEKVQWSQTMVQSLARQFV